MPTPLAVRKILSSAMIGAAKSGSDVCSRLWVRGVKPDTPIADLLGGKALRESAFADVSVAISTATDHLHALARVIRLPVELGPSIATLSRGTIEALGRAWWLLDVQDAAAMEHRSAVMRLAELSTAKKRGVTTSHLRTDGDREDLNIDLAIDEAKRRLTGQPQHLELDIPRYTVLATTVMAAAGVKKAATEYSHLSGAAHGENLTALGFSSVCRETGRMGLPYRYLDMYAWTVLHTVDLVVTHLIDLWDAGEELERWSVQRDRTYKDFDTLRNIVINYRAGEQQ